MSADDHHESRSNALVPRPGTDLAETGRRTNPVIARMTRDVLARVESRGLSTARYRIGDFLLREPDYRQILQWAIALSKTPEWVLVQLADSKLEPEVWDDFEPMAFVLEDGAIRSLVWHFDYLPFVPDQWQKDLLIYSLGFKGTCPEPQKALRPCLAKLQNLCCPQIAITQLDLSRMPELASLECMENNLTELDFSHVPRLTKLKCGNSHLTKLDLSPVSRLTQLWCYRNQLKELDLSPVPGLTELSCWHNQLTALDLSPVPELTELDCGGNHLRKLDLSPVQRLTKLHCDHNPLNILDLSPVPELSELFCGANNLAKLDLSPVPCLTNLGCHNNRLTELNLSPVPELRLQLWCDGNQFSELDLSPVPALTNLQCDQSVHLHNAPAHLLMVKRMG